jgi:hypothetical protein
MPSPVQELATNLLRAIAAQRPSDFTGLGIVFYEHLDALPHIQLALPPQIPMSLPVSGLEAMASALAFASRTSSGCHDGFHFVDVSSRCLTHLAQYLSPPLPPQNSPTPKASGARHMTAYLATRIAGIAGVGILTNSNEMVFFDSDAQTPRVTIL